MKIAFSGKICSGKTTCAERVCATNPGFVKLSFASKLKELAVELFDMKNKNRYLLQTLGSKLKEIDQEVWIKYTMKECRKHTHIVIDDVRFPNEYRKLKENGFTIIRLNIDKELQVKRIKKLYKDSESQLSRLDNETETALDGWEFDYVLDAGDPQMELKILNIINEQRNREGAGKN